MRVVWQAMQAVAGVVAAILTLAGRLDRASTLLGLEENALVRASLFIAIVAFVLTKIVRFVALLTVRPELRYVNVVSTPAGRRLRGEVLVRNARLLLWPRSGAEAVRFRVEVLTVPDAIVGEVQQVLPSIEARRWNRDPAFTFDVPLRPEQADSALAMQQRSAWLKGFRARIGGWTITAREPTSTSLGVA